MSDAVDPRPVQSRRDWLPVLPIWVSLVGWSLLRVPVPGVNEPHYLGKARHWWTPEWCPGDFFLDSSNPHLVFYATLGWFASVVSLEAAAVIGRVSGLLVVAFGWQRLALAVTGNVWGGLLSIPVFLLLQVLGNFSGEWLIGGIEAKVPAVGFLFWGLGNALLHCPRSAAILLGLSVSLHPLIGLWGASAALFASLWNFPILRRQPVKDALAESPIGVSDCFTTMTLREGAITFSLFFLAALPGLVPALLTLQAPDRKIELTATQLQVAGRLSHHLDPMAFPKENYRYWGLMLVLWLLIDNMLPSTPQSRWWRRFVFCTVGIALAGVVIGWGPRPIPAMFGYEWRMKLLKFYFFRLGDLMVPVALSLGSSRLGLQAAATLPRRKGQLIYALALAAATAGALGIHFPDENPSRLTSAQLQDWKSACAWVHAHSSPADLCYVSDSGWALKWFAERPEYVSYKDMPQDAQSIVEWNRRLWVIANWRIDALRDAPVTADELARLRRTTGIRYLICRRFGPLETQPAYANDTFRVYELPPEPR